MAARQTSLIPFFLLSLGLHLFLFFLWPKALEQQTATEQIRVVLLSSPEEKKPEASQPASEPSTRPSKAPAQLAKKSTPVAEPIAKVPPPRAKERVPEELPERERKRKEPSLDSYKEAPERYTIVRRPLPTLKELLPPATLLPSDNAPKKDEGPIPLGSREPKYISYFDSIRRAIELVWEYPQAALHEGLQGKLILRFTILQNGDLEGTRLIRSSGFNVLDQEALRAVQAASPFRPIPPWIGRSRLEIIASFEYHDNRLRYTVVP